MLRQPLPRYAGDRLAESLDILECLIQQQRMLWGLRAHVWCPIREEYRESAQHLDAPVEVFDQRGFELPIMISGTITDASGRTLSGQRACSSWGYAEKMETTLELQKPRHK